MTENPIVIYNTADRLWSSPWRSAPEKVATHPRQVEPETQEPTPVHRRLIKLTVAEIRHLLHLDRRNKDAENHGLRWSIFRRSHQAASRRAHVRRHLRLQMLVI